MVAKREETKFFELFVLSGVAAGVSKTVAAPLERVKLLVQSQDEMIKQVSNMQELQNSNFGNGTQKICLLLAKTYVFRVDWRHLTRVCWTAQKGSLPLREFFPSGEVKSNDFNP